MIRFTTKRQVEFRDTDAAGMVHFSVFFNYMEEAEHAFLRSLGLSVLTHDALGPLSWPRVRASCDYKQAVRFEQVVDIDLSVRRVGEKSVTYDFAFRQGPQVVAHGELTTVCCRLSAAAPPQSIAIPAEIRARLEAP